MSSGSGRAFCEQGNGLVALKRSGDRERLVLRAFDVGAFHVNGVVLVREPVDERVAKLVLGDKSAASRAADHDNVEPAEVIGDEQGVRVERRAIRPHARAEDPADSGKEASRPMRAAQHSLG